MFRTVTLTGIRGSLVWGAADAAVLPRWALARDEQGAWTLSACVEQIDRYRVRQVPLLFQAPRTAKPAGLWCFPVVPQTLQIDGPTLTARLGPPEGR